MFEQIFKQKTNIINNNFFEFEDCKYSFQDFLTNDKLQFCIFKEDSLKFARLGKREKNNFIKNITETKEAKEKVDYSDRILILSDIITGSLICIDRKTESVLETNGRVMIERKFYPEKKVEPAKIVFKTDKKSGIIGFDERLHCLIYNIYKAPDYLEDSVKSKNNSLVVKFIETLIPNRFHREWLLAWLYRAIIDRNETIPILLGRQGSGKNTLIEGIIFPLVGDSHLASSSLLNNKIFNAELNNKRIVFYDEIALGKNSVNKLKSYTNNSIAMERKGKEVINKENYASFIGAGNLSEGRIYTTADERRLSFLDVHKKMLSDVFTKDEIEYLHNGFKKDLESQKGLYEYLKSYDFSSIDVWKPIRGEQYYRCLFNSFDYLIRTLILDFILLDKKVDYKTLVRHYKAIGGSNQIMQPKLIDQLKQFDLDGISPCSVSFEEDSTICEFIPNKNFVNNFEFLVRNKKINI